MKTLCLQINFTVVKSLVDFFLVVIYSINVLFLTQVSVISRISVDMSHPHKHGVFIKKRTRAPRLGLGLVILTVVNSDLVSSLWDSNSSLSVAGDSDSGPKDSHSGSLKPQSSQHWYIM